jgi:hypothetical protein
MWLHLRDLLETRLRLVAAWNLNSPGLAALGLEKPLFIVGMPRSGSTFLHELLAQNPEYRAPRVWEVMFPLSRTSEEGDDTGCRIRKADACLWWFRRLAPSADEVYPMRALTPHECVAIHSYTFFSEEFVSTCRVPSYECFLHSHDLKPAYAWQKRFLQHLQFERPGKRWVLKSPDHVLGLEGLFAVFPDAVIVQTHRNPVEVLVSSANLTRVLRELYGSAGDFAELQAREARVLAQGTERLIQFRDAHPELSDRFIDVKYTELVADPVETVRRVCEQSATPFTRTTAEKVKNLASCRSRYAKRRTRVKRIRPEQTMGAEIHRFERYCSRFDLSLIPMELG